jgi:hypothetical protein
MYQSHKTLICALKMIGYKRVPTSGKHIYQRNKYPTIALTSVNHICMVDGKFIDIHMALDLIKAVKFNN